MFNSIFIYCQCPHVSVDFDVVVKRTELFRSWDLNVEHACQALIGINDYFQNGAIRSASDAAVRAVLGQ